MGEKEGSEGSGTQEKAERGRRAVGGPHYLDCVNIEKYFKSSEHIITHL